jgi:hypothetical protein
MRGANICIGEACGARGLDPAFPSLSKKAAAQSKAGKATQAVALHRLRRLEAPSAFGRLLFANSSNW